jgi:hypothetical protein
MKEEISLRVINNKNLGKANITLFDKGNIVQLDFSYKNISFSEVDEFAFIALNKIRLKLEEMDLKLICQGCRIDVYPVGIYFSGYELELGKPAINSVYLFDDTSYIERIGTVKEQDLFYDKWLKSVGFSKSEDKIDINDPQNTIGSYWWIINLDNWGIQSKEFQRGIIKSIEAELKKIKKLGFVDVSSLKKKFEKKLNESLNV